MSLQDHGFTASGKGALNAAHNALIFNRRIRVLGKHLSSFLPQNGVILDVGCGDGQVAVQIMGHRPGLKFSGVDVMVRPKTHIEVVEYDGDRLPFADDSFDFVTIVDVLHHTDDPAKVLREAQRVARFGIVLKDHLRQGLMAGPVLRAMDWVGNRGHDVLLPYNYLSRSEWNAAFETAGCRVDGWKEKLDLYPAPVNWVCDRKLHFVALLKPIRKS